MPWVKGQSGNPSGQPKKLLPGGKSIRDLAREYTSEALNALVEVVRNGESEQARTSAANAILDRGWGKPTQPIAGDGDMPPLAVASAPDQVLAWIASQQIEGDGETVQ